MKQRAVRTRFFFKEVKQYSTFEYYVFYKYILCYFWCLHIVYFLQALKMFVYSIPNSALIMLNIKTIQCYTVKFIEKVKII